MFLIASCLTQALATRTLLNLKGQKSHLKIGVDKDKKENFEAHAWIEKEGKIIIGKLPRHQQRFVILNLNGLGSYMSAITLIYNLNQRPITDGEMRLFLDSLKHRGSDDKGIVIEKNIGLGHRMRWTTPESLQEKLPAKNADGSIFITCDARIDNRDELIPQLSFSRKKPNEIADSEIILKAYEKWGEEFLPKLIGDFVFAIWDANKQKLHLCQRFDGHKAFLLLLQTKSIICASHPKLKLFIAIPTFQKN